MFYRLKDLHPSAEITVEDTDGRTVHFRLVTCGGTFDRSRGSYRDNVVAFARRR